MASVFLKRKAWIAQSTWTGRKVSASLGRLDRRDAEFAEQMLTQIERSRGAASSIGKAAAAWLAGISDRVHAAVVKLGLAEPRMTAAAMPTTLVKLFADYRASRKDLSWRASDNIRQAGVSMCECFGEIRAVSRLTDEDGEKWKTWMSDQGFAASTISGHIKKAKQVFARAVKDGLLSRSPLAGLKAGDQVNDSRGRYITAEMVRDVMSNASPMWRLLLAMARFGGLRIPSEVALLKWSHFDFDSKLITIHSPKTRRMGRASRQIPMFDDLLEPIAAAWVARDESSDDVFPGFTGEHNVRTTVMRLVRRAGLEPWPRLLHNLRASCQTDLDERYSPRTACQWLGNSPSTSRKHYLQVKGEHWRRASAKASALDVRSLAQLARMAGDRMNNSFEKYEMSSIPMNATVPPLGVVQQQCSQTHPLSRVRFRFH